MIPSFAESRACLAELDTCGSRVIEVVTTAAGLGSKTICGVFRGLSGDPFVEAEAPMFGSVALLGNSALLVTPPERRSVKLLLCLTALAISVILFVVDSSNCIAATA